MSTGVETIANFTMAKSKKGIHLKIIREGKLRWIALLKTPWRPRVSAPSESMNDAERLITFG